MMLDISEDAHAFDAFTHGLLADLSLLLLLLFFALPGIKGKKKDIYFAVLESVRVEKLEEDSAWILFFFFFFLEMSRA